MNQSLILHIPHASTNIPFYNGYVVDRKTINQEIMWLTDWFTDKLFRSDEDIMVVADFSRIFCDVERFVDDDKEVMAKVGMGVCYETLDTGGEMRIVTPDLKKKILEGYYYKHHQRLSDAVSEQLKQFDRALILDCHSFPNTPFKRDQVQQPERPDICIGTDKFHTPKALIDNSFDYFREKGYRVSINSPYSGSMVPSEYYGKDKRVQSIMLEVNRKLYLQDAGNERPDKYNEMNALIWEYMALLRRCFLFP